jgi:hypothetical protein
MDKVDITMTSVIRPAILNDSLNSIVKNLVSDQNRFRLIINVDPIGENVHPMKMIKVAKKHFKNVIYNIANKPSFPKAVKWVWSQSSAPYVFHWEDDVSLFRKIDINDMIKIHEKHPGVASLRLFIQDTPNKKIIKVFRSEWHYNKDGFYIANRWQEQFGLNPSLIKQAFVKEAINIFRDDINPEKVFRTRYSWAVPLISKWKYGLYTKPGDKMLVSGKGSAGHIWKKKMGLTKSDKQFLKWVKK